VFAARCRIERALGDYLRGESGAGKGPLVIVVLAIGVLWAWHVPALYDLAVRNEDVHYAEHAGFLITSLLFWAAVLRLRPRDHLDNGLRILYVFAMAIQGSLLGALLTFASRPLYAAHAHIPARWHLSQLVDQQIAGLIMWIPPAVLYVLAEGGGPGHARAQ
jgi:putative membrane protein